MTLSALSSQLSAFPPLARRARGVDDRPIVTERAAKSISQETTFAHDVRDRHRLEQGKDESKKLRAENGSAVAAGREVVRFSAFSFQLSVFPGWPDFTTPTRQLTLPRPTDEAEVITDAALRLFNQTWPERQPVRLIGVGVGGLGTPPRQLSLWDAPSPEEQARAARLRAALAAVQARFGAGVVRRGSELGTEEE